MPIFKFDRNTIAFFLFNKIIARFRIPSEIVTDHGSHFQNEMMEEITTKLGFKNGHSSPYYPYTNREVEAVNKSLKTIFAENCQPKKI
jgi:transposase InsO family protein